MQDTNKNIIREYGKKIGFCDVGFAAAEPFAEEIERYNDHLAKGYHAAMKYLEKKLPEREDVTKLLPAAKTVIVAAQSYYTPFEHESGSVGKIARYAWGGDYHEIVKNKLNLLSDKIKELDKSAQTMCFVDSGSVLEKPWAVRAGIGWQGRNSLIISPKTGSWIFIGIIVTDAFFAPDEKAVDRCGSCHQCVEACPTGALDEPYALNAGKCISYWNIESKNPEEMPEDIKNNLNGWLYGCDMCQNACPWNKQKPASENKEYYPVNNETCITPQKILSMSDSELKARFANTPITRQKPDRMKKIAGILMKNL